MRTCSDARRLLRTHYNEPTRTLQQRRGELSLQRRIAIDAQVTQNAARFADEADHCRLRLLLLECLVDNFESDWSPHRDVKRLCAGEAATGARKARVGVGEVEDLRRRAAKGAREHIGTSVHMDTDMDIDMDMETEVDREFAGGTHAACTRRGCEHGDAYACACACAPRSS